MHFRKCMVRKAAVILSAVLLFPLAGCTAAEPGRTEPEQPLIVTVWHYYNGTQKEIFDGIVEEFNETEGRTAGIRVEAVSKGTITQMEEAVSDNLSGKVGAEELPNLLAVYSDMAYEIDRAGKAADLRRYFTDEELEEYMDSYLDEGEFGAAGELKLFPIAKSTELFAINWTDWQVFAGETGAAETDFATWEGIVRLAQSYYEWTDSKTEEPDDGKAFFGRDAFANYMIIGSLQLGHEITPVENGTVNLDFDKDAVRRLWDNYYLPYISGCFASYGKFRSDDVKTGDLLAFVGSTSGVTYFPSEVTYEDGSTHKIESRVFPAPGFEGMEPCAVQQGAGMLLVAGEQKMEESAALFLKWFTDEKQNMKFAVGSGYLPVKKAANDPQKIRQEIPDSGLVQNSLLTGIQIVNSSRLYTTKPFAGGNDVRDVLNTAMDQKAKDDRKAVELLMEQGMSRMDAVSRYDTEENFEKWYEDTKKQLETIGERYGW